MALNTDGVNIIITGDASQVIKEIEATEKAIAGVKGSQINITANSSQAVGEAQKVVDVIDSVNDGHVEITADSSQAVDAVEKVAAEAGSISDANIEITADSSQAVDAAGKAADAIENIDGGNVEITADGSQAVDELKKVQEYILNLNGREVKFTVSPIFKDSQGRWHDINGKFLKMGEQAGKSFASGAEQGITKIEQSINKMLAFEAGSKLSSGFGAVLTNIISGLQKVTALTSSVIKSALAIGGGFESQMTAVKVISGATGEELDILTKKAREMGATLPITAKDSAMAMTVLAQRGTSVKDILASVSDVANLAISQGVSMGAAADLLGSTITNFGLAMEDASKVTAIFNNASNQSALNMSKLIMAMKYVGPSAGSVGMELTEAVSALEALANAGLTGEMSGTGLAMVLTKLASKTRIMGVETKDTQDNLRPLADIFSELQAKGFSLAEATAEFGARGRLAALNLAKQSASLKENEERLKQWGSTQAAVDEKAKTFSNTMAALQSAIEEFHIEVFTQIKEQSKDAVSGITQLVRVFAEWVGQTKAAEKALNAFLDGLGFRIPTGADFKKLLEQIDVDSIAEKIKTLGSTIRSIADGIISFANKIQTPLMFLIKHLDTFANISFWGWIGGKALQIPLTLVMMAAGFTQLCSALKALTVLKFGSILGFLSSPALIGTAGVVALGAFATKKVLDYKNAKDELEKALDEEKRYIQEQAKADSTIELDIQTNIKTGFEKLPESWIKASDELRAQANVTVQALRETFKKNVVTAIDAVIDKFPEMADALDDINEEMNDAFLVKLTKALQGDKEAFEALSAPMKKVVEQLYYMDVQAGQATGSLGKLLIEMKALEEKAAAGNKPIKTQLALFTEELSASVAALLDSVPANIEKFQEFLGNQNIELPVNVSLEQAQKQIQELSKSIGEKFNIPADIVTSAIFTQLDKLANKGDKTAQALRNGWKDASKTLEDFMQSAQDAVKYLGASPEKFTPALNSLTKGIQKIDPLTGKVTEQFKKAYDALKQWSSVTFDQLAQRIQRIKKAVEGGFIDQSALEAEFERASKQVKLQVSAELAPTRESYKSQDAFNSVVASEYVARMGELGGEAFMDLLQREFSGLYEQSGAAIGAAIMRQVDNGLNSATVMKFNGVDMLKQNGQTQSELDFSAFSKALTDTVNPLISKIEQVTIPQAAFGNDISSHFPEIITAMDKLQSGINNNSSILGRTNDALLTLVNSIGNISTQNTANPVITVQDYSSQFANIIKEIQAVSAGLAAVQNIVQANVNAVNGVTSAVGGITSAVSSVESAVKSQQVALDGNVFTKAIAPLLAVLQDIAGSSSAIHSIQQYRSDYLNEILSSIKNVDNSVKAVDVSMKNWHQNNNSSVDADAISQAIIAGLSPVLLNLDAGKPDYQSVLADVVRNILTLQQSMDALKSSADSNINAISGLQSSISSIDTSNKSGEDISGRLAPLVNAVQSLAVTVGNIQSVNQANSSAIAGVTSAVKAVENAVKSINSGNNYDIDINQQGFIIEKRADADLVARNTASALRSGLGNGGV